MRVKNYYVYFWIDEENSKVQVTAVIYVARDQAIILLIKLNAECARLHWSRSIKDIPSDVMNALCYERTGLSSSDEG